MKPVQRRQWVDFLIETFDVSIAKACEVAGLSRGAYYYVPKRADDSDVIAALLALVERHPRWVSLSYANDCVVWVIVGTTSEYTGLLRA